MLCTKKSEQFYLNSLGQQPRTLQALAVVRVLRLARVGRRTGEAPRPLLSTTLSISSHSRVRRKSQNPLGRPLRGNDDQSRGVGGWHAREDGRVDHEQVVGTVYLSVGVDNRRAASATVVGTQLGRAHPVVGPAVGVGYEHLYKSVYLSWVKR